MDANLAAATTKQIQLDLATAESTVIPWQQPHRTVRSLSADDVAAALDHAGDLAEILKDAERDSRARCTGPSVSNCSSTRSDTGSRLGCRKVLAGARYARSRQHSNCPADVLFSTACARARTALRGSSYGRRDQWRSESLGGPVASRANAEQRQRQCGT